MLGPSQSPQNLDPYPWGVETDQMLDCPLSEWVMGLNPYHHRLWERVGRCGKYWQWRCCVEEEKSLLLHCRQRMDQDVEGSLQHFRDC